MVAQRGSDSGLNTGMGFASSPVVVDDVVIVAASGKLALQRLDGEPRWFARTAEADTARRIWRLSAESSRCCSSAERR